MMMSANRQAQVRMIVCMAARRAFGSAHLGGACCAPAALPEVAVWRFGMLAQGLLPTTAKTVLLLLLLGTPCYAVSEGIM
jgi:hypothetical protein